ncbi:MAG: flagellin lysine-N-methylase [Clostridiaceae bacterium]|nr:flagellin lysine-N-methylase [Clostridiaceae bacterium]
MEYIVLGLYPHFSCLADQCSATCCSGWKIYIDKEAYSRFQKIQPEWLRGEILAAVEKQGDKLFFKNRQDGSCRMLEENGLCHIQRYTDEKTLCNTCRKYPRLFGEAGQHTWLSMAASCPVVSAYLLKGDITWHSVTEYGEIHSVRIREIGDIKAVLQLWEENHTIADMIFRENPDNGLICSCFEKMINQLLDVVLSYRESAYLLPSFSFFEEQREWEVYLSLFEAFRTKTAAIWEKLQQSYLDYRIAGYLMECREQQKNTCYEQIMGELFLIRILVFSHYGSVGSVEDADWQKAIQVMYRFCAHGQGVAALVHNIFCEFFVNRYLWNYILL